MGRRGTENSKHGLITKTTDGGLTWNSQYYNTTTGLVYKIFFIDENKGWASCGYGNILFTTNGGPILVNGKYRNINSFNRLFLR